MPPFPGEERLVTVFADIHYYFAQPTVRPQQHRFDKASYFYIYYNSTRQTSRVEVANNPGTSDQDAFNGYIDSCRIINSHKFPTLMTIVVDDVTPQSPTSPRSGRDPEEWCLTIADARDPNRRKYKLHTVDVYFWALDDAKLVLECFKKLLPANQLDVAELEPEPEPEQPYHSTAKSSENPTSSLVVQNLENMAVSDPAYNGLHKSANAVSPSSSFASHTLPVTIPPPPPPSGLPGRQIHSPSPAISEMSSQHGRQASIRANKPQSSDFTPMAYNPAAPPAPEPIAHREKTPPPEDAVDGTGLTQAAKHEYGYVPGASPQGGHSIGQGPPATFGGGYASPPPQQSSYFSTPPPPPPTSSTATYTSPPPTNYSHGQLDNRSSATSTAPSFGPGAASTISQPHRQSTAAETYVPSQTNQQPVQTPGSQFYSSLQQPAKPLAHVQPQYADYLSSGSTTTQQQGYQPPVGGYSQYNYAAGAQNQQQGSNNPYDVHQQLYRPTESEAGAHGHKKPSRTSTGDNKKQSTSDKVEKSARSLFKRIEKKIG